MGGILISDMLSWTRQQIAAEMAVAQAALAPDDAWYSPGELYRDEPPSLAWKESEFLALYTPGQVIARCESDLFILDCHEGSHECSGPDDNCLWILDGHFCPTVRALAWGRRHRPGYLPEWAPEGMTP